MRTAFISGHLFISKEEFGLHYMPRIEAAFNNGHRFVVGDAAGVDSMAQAYLEILGAKDVVVYHMFSTPRHNVGNFPTEGGYTADEWRDAAMTRNSDYDILWVKPGKENSGTAKNEQRREQKTIAEADDRD